MAWSIRDSGENSVNSLNNAPRRVEFLDFGIKTREPDQGWHQTKDDFQHRQNSRQRLIVVVRQDSAVPPTPVPACG